MDARQMQTDHALAASVLELAGSSNVHDITVTALARHAGVNRTTIYSRTDSVLDLLEQSLRADLDNRSTRLVEARVVVPAATSAATAIEVLLDHLEAHSSIYRWNINDAKASLQAMLVQHLDDALWLQWASASHQRPEGVPADDLDVELEIAFLSVGAVGAIRSWLALPQPRNRELLLEVLARMTPSWLVLPPGMPSGPHVVDGL